jgi:hypothetical protein
MFQLNYERYYDARLLVLTSYIRVFLFWYFSSSNCSISEYYINIWMVITLYYYKSAPLTDICPNNNLISYMKLYYKWLQIKILHKYHNFFNSCNNFYLQIHYVYPPRHSYAFLVSGWWCLAWLNSLLVQQYPLINSASSWAEIAWLNISKSLLLPCTFQQSHCVNWVSLACKRLEISSEDQW